MLILNSKVQRTKIKTLRVFWIPSFPSTNIKKDFYKKGETTSLLFSYLMDERNWFPVRKKSVNSLRTLYKRSTFGAKKVKIKLCPPLMTTEYIFEVNK